MSKLYKVLILFSQALFCLSGLRESIICAFFSAPLLLSPLLSLAEELNSPPAQTKVVSESEISKSIARLSLEQKIGQMFIFGFPGQEINQPLIDWFSKHQPGSLIIFRRNIRSPEQLFRLNNSLQKIALKQSGLPLFLMVDQEGGNVSRVRMNPPPPSALAMGMTNDPELVKEIGSSTGQLLKLLGFNMNLAPVFDLSDPFEKNFIGNRAFGGNPESATKMALAFSAGLSSSGILATAKHFPGHGRVSQDSHKQLPFKNSTLAELEKEDLLPFKKFAESKMPSAVMVAHLALPKIDASGLPATFSKEIITTLLRKRLGYSGLVMTDDIEMIGASSAGDVGERAVKAIEAGCDLIMVAWSPSRQVRAIRAVYRAVRSGRLSEERINASLERVLAQKLYLAKSSQPTISSEFTAPFRDEYLKMKSALAKLSRRVIELNFERATKGYSYLKQTIPANRPLVVFSAEKAFADILASNLKRPVSFVRLKKSKNFSAEHFLEDEDSLGVFYVSGVGSSRLLAQVPKEMRSKVLVINTTHPGLVNKYEDFWAVINLNSPNIESAELTANYFFKAEEDAEPLDLNDDDIDNRQPATD